MVAAGKPDLATALASLREAIEQSFGATPTEVLVKLAGRRKPMRLPFPPPSTNSNGADPCPFVPTAYQSAILEALEGKALRTDALAGVVGDRSRLFRHPGGLKELQERGLVAHHKRLGFYRPDVPPEELTGE